MCHFLIGILKKNPTCSGQITLQENKGAEKVVTLLSQVAAEAVNLKPLKNTVFVVFFVKLEVMSLSESG